MYILGIETSCDETSAAVSKHRSILSNITINQIIHTEYGGVVPEIASREHLVLIDKVVSESINQSGINAKDFLQNIISNDIKLVDNSNSICKGKLVSTSKFDAFSHKFL